MPSPLCVDLRERVVFAVSEGASCHQAAAWTPIDKAVLSPAPQPGLQSNQAGLRQVEGTPPNRGGPHGR